MIISVNWLKQFTAIDASVDELAGLIGSRLVEIEGVDSIGEKYKDVIIARIVSARPVEDSDHLNLTLIDDGGVREGVERNEDGLVQVVCGAPNVREGMLVAWLPPGSTVPDSVGNEPFVLGARKLRGYISNGMLASARELALFDAHDGIVEVDKDVAPGTAFAAAYALDDHLLDIENKSLTHRPDTFGVVGFAREVAAIGGLGFETPSWLVDLNPSLGPSGETYQLTTAIDDAALSARYSAVVLSGIDRTATTPLEIQTYLSRSGVRPINAVVDVTNYLMLLSGQPLHAFDYDKVAALAGADAPHLHVRAGHVDEKLVLLDGRTIAVTPADIVIAAGSGDRDTAVALAGAMGGADTEIDDQTTTIVLESATFDLYRLRATQMRHGVFSEAITRFTKGQPAALTLPVLAQAARMLSELTGARVASHVADSYETVADQPTLTLTPARLNGLLGTKYSAADVVETLRNVEFDAETAEGASPDGSDVISVTPPYWRTDIHIDEDVIEEVGRLNGFDLIEPELPLRPFTAVTPDDFDGFRSHVRSTLSTAGANEVLTYSFVHGDLLTKVGQDPEHAYKLANAISPDLQYYRVSLTPSLLTAVTPNLRGGFDEFALYEVGKVHATIVTDPESDLPHESHRLGFTYAADAKAAAERGSAYYTARHYLSHLLAAVHVDGAVEFSELIDDDLSAPFETKRAARVTIDGKDVGVIGEYTTGVTNTLKLPVFSSGFELDLEALHDASSKIGRYTPSGRFQGSDADVTFIAGADIPYADLMNALTDSLTDSGYRFAVRPGTIYATDGTTRNVTFRIALSSDERTLSRNDVNKVVADVITAVTAATGARTA